MQVAHRPYWHRSMLMPQLQLRNEIHEEAHPMSHENWRNPNRGSSNYFQKMYWSHTTRGRHICFQMTVLCNYCTCYYETHMVWSFDTFYNLTVTPMSKIKRIKTYVVQHFRIFKQETTLLKIVREFLSVLYRLKN